MPEKIRTCKELLADCRSYVESSGMIAETAYDDWEGEYYLDPRVKEAAARVAALLAEIDYELSTKH